METAKLSKASLEDIVFEGRNRAYGAYLLRKLYNKHITVATIIAISICILFLSIPLIAKLFESDEVEVEKPKVVTVVTLDQPPPIDKTAPPPPPPPPDLPPPPPPVRSTIKFTPPVVKKDEQVREQEEMPDQDKLKTVDAGVKTVKGNDSAVPSLEGIEGGTGPSDVVAEVVEEKPYTYVEQMPTFPGGETEMLKFIGKNVVYPSAAKRSGLEGTVYIQFTVGRTGEISDIKVVKGLGGGTDEEAIRVVKMMPKWKAGKQNGREVPVRFTLPFRFTLK